MRLFTTLSLLAIGLTNHAQTIVSDSAIYRFFNDQVQRWNETVYQAALDGDIPLYKNPEFSSEWSKEDFHYIGTQEEVIQLTKYGELMDSIIATPFDPKAGFDGISFLFGTDYNLESGSYQLIFKGFSPIIQLEASGVELGPLEMLWVPAHQASKLFSSDEFKLLKAFAIQHINFGDLTPPYISSIREVSPKTRAEEFVINEGIQNHYRLIRVSNNDLYLQSLYSKYQISFALSQIAKAQNEGVLKEKLLFQHSDLKKPYRNPTTDLGDTMFWKVMQLLGDTLWCFPEDVKEYFNLKMNDPKELESDPIITTFSTNGNDLRVFIDLLHSGLDLDPEDFKDTFSIFDNQFSDFYNFNLLKHEEEIVVDMVVPIGKNYSFKHVFMSWERTKEFLNPLNVYVLDTFFTRKMR